MNKLQLPDSLWAATANAAPSSSQLSGDTTVDVAIIGAGFNGLRAGICLAEAGKNVAVVDAGDIGWGASGRNGGQVNPIGHEPPATVANRWKGQYDDVYAQRFPKFIYQSADELFDVVRRYSIDCDAEQNGWIRAVHGNSALAEFEAMFDGWSAAGAEIKMVDRAELESISGSSRYQKGWVAARGGTVQPLSYARGLATAAISAGAQVFTHTKVDALRPQGDGWVLQTAQGTINADQVVLSTNGYTDDLCRGLKETVVPIISIQAATQPLTQEQDARILPGRHTFSDSRRVIYYFKKTGDNRLVFGSAGFSGEQPGEPDRRRILEGLTTVYPFLSGIKLDYLWGGRIAVTHDHLPHIHQPAPGLWTGLGCNGRGVALSTAMGRLLSEMVLGKDPGELPLPVTGLKPFPFHRFHRIGAKVALHWKELQDKREASV